MRVLEDNFAPLDEDVSLEVTSWIGGALQGSIPMPGGHAGEVEAVLL